MEKKAITLTLDQLIEQIGHSCNYLHQICTQLNKSLIKFHQQGDKVNDLFVSRLMGMISHNDCLTYLTEYYKIFAYYDPPAIIWRSIILGSKIDVIVNTMKARGVIFSNELITSLLTVKRVNYLHQPSIVDYNISLMVSRCYDLTKETLREALENNLIAASTSILNMGVIGDISSLRQACRFDNIVLIQTILKHDITPDLMCLEEACRVGNYSIIIQMLKYRIVPSQKCIKSLFDNAPKYHITNRRRQAHRYCYGGKLTEANINELIELMIADGYKLTIEDVGQSLQTRIKLNNLFIYGIPFDSKLMSLCHKYDFYPYDFQIEQDINCLRELCGKPAGLPQVKKLVNAGVAPDQICLEKAILSNNYQTADYLINQCDLPVSINILNDIANVIHNPMLSMVKKKIIDKYSKLETDSIKPKSKLKTKSESQSEILTNELSLPTLQPMMINITCYDFSENTLPIPNIKKKIILKKSTRDALVLPSHKQTSYLELKTLLFNKIRQDKLFVNDNETIIKITKPMENATNLPCTEFYDINDIDQIVVRLFNI